MKEIEEEIKIGYEEEPYKDGFNLKTVFAALFIGFIILPGAIYLGLLTGQSLAGAAEWVTIILFIEITKRSLGKMSRQEIYVIYSIAGGLIAPGVVLGAATLVLHGGFFSQNIWNQFLRQSPQAEAFGLTKLIPNWVVPALGSEALAKRTFFHQDW
ncbi:peptide transporter, partial [Candidatus Desantisbacteria bacterium CG_4_10_14_0_8_um_filter_39_17]